MEQHAPPYMNYFQILAARQCIDIRNVMIYLCLCNVNNLPPSHLVFISCLSYTRSVLLIVKNYAAKCRSVLYSKAVRYEIFSHVKDIISPH